MRNKQIAYPYVGWMALFVIAPILIIAVYAFTTSGWSLTLENFQNMTKFAAAFGRSFLLAAIATVICLLIGYPLAYILSKERGWLHRMATMLIMLPMWMNFLLRTLAWQTLLEKNGVINHILSFLHLPTLKIINTPAAIILGMVYNFLPFMVLPLYNALSKIDVNVINAAHDLGANNIYTFIRIILPLSVPGIISGVTMVFIPALTTFVISALLGGGKLLLIGDVIEQEFTRTSNWHLGSGLSMVLMVFILLNMVLSAIFDKEGEGSML